MKQARNSFGKPYDCKKDWPEDCGVQCGGKGIVLGGEGSLEKTLKSGSPLETLAEEAAHPKSYTTAFFEAFPKDPSCFIRGEGASIEEAEASAWDKYQKIKHCDHEMERRKRRDGYGYCKHCSYSAMVFEPLTKCCKCGEPTRYTADHKDRWYCEKHARVMPKNPNPSSWDMDEMRLPRKKKKALKEAAEILFREKGLTGKVKARIKYDIRFTCESKQINLLFKKQRQALLDKARGIVQVNKIKQRYYDAIVE